MASLARELRGPATVVAGIADLLEVDGLDPSVRTRLLRSLERQSRLLALLADDLLALDPDAVVQGRREPVDVVAIVRDVVARHRGVGLWVGEGLRGDPGLAVDGAWLGRAVAHLVANAVTHGAPPWEVVLDRAAEGLSITVSDHGSGVAGADVPLLFEAFHRGPHGHRGAGLGLHSVRAFARAHGGEATYRPGDRGGAVLTVTVPAPGDVPPSSGTADPA